MMNGEENPNPSLGGEVKLEFGPVIGPLIGAFVVDRTHSWRWLLWIVVIASGAVTACSAVFLQETYVPFLRRKQGRDGRDGKVRATELFAGAILRPFQLLFFSPICTIMSFYMALIFGAIYLHLVTIPLLYGPEPLHGLFSYEWKGGLTGLAYLGAGLGIVIGTFICTKYLNRSYTWLAERNPRQSNKPESRMLFLQIGMLIVPFGLIIFAWTAEKQQHWALPLLGAAIFASGIFMAFLCVQTYLVDVYGEYSASALAAMIAARSIGSCMFSVVGFQLYVSLGYGWGTMVVAFVCLAALPVPMFVYKSGPRLRSNRRQML